MPAKITGYTVHTHYTHTIYTQNIHTHAMKLKVGMIIAIVPNSTAKKKSLVCCCWHCYLFYTLITIYIDDNKLVIFSISYYGDDYIIIIHTQNISQLSDTNYYCVWYTQGAMKEATGTWKSLSVSEKKVQSTYVAVLGRNRTFCCVFQSCHCLWSAVVQSLC